MTKTKFFLFFITLIFISALSYICVRFFHYIMAEQSLLGKILAFMFLMAELFIIIHTIGYFLNLRRVKIYTPSLPSKPLEKFPPVAVVLASYKEPLEVINDSLICFYNLSYPNKVLYLLDDTRYDLPWDTEDNKKIYQEQLHKLCKELGVNVFHAKWHHAKAGILNDFLQFLNGVTSDDFKFYPYGKPKIEKEKFLLVFDADMNAFPDIVEDLVARMERDPKAAFVQTPQYYTNFDTNRVARAAGLQQAIFYEYICEGKGLQNTMFCCGTNVLYRIEALQQVGGFEEESVTEDFATSLKLHLQGWNSIYHNRVIAFGMGPEDLGSFFKQQFRWAVGTISLLKKFPFMFLEYYKKSSTGLWWEYLLSGTHYFIGCVIFMFFITPVLYIFFDHPKFFGDPLIYFLTYFPYIFLTFMLFFLTLRERGYRTLPLLSAVVINTVAFPVFIKATLSGILGIKTHFVVTPKEGFRVLTLGYLLPQLIMGLLCAAAITWGFARIYYERELAFALSVNIFWTVINFSMISFFLYFNHSEEVR